MQGLADGYFVIPYTIGDYLASVERKPVSTDSPEFDETEKLVKEKLNHLLSVKGKRTVHEFHRELGLLMWNHCGMARNEKGLNIGLEKIKKLKEEYWQNVRVMGEGKELNQNLEHAGRVADFLELGELMMRDALHRNESCGGHFREEYQTPDNEALRDDDHYSYVAAWKHNGENVSPEMIKEPLIFENVKPSQRSYK
jgi:succinate dehydrogenase / fumarate reductase flavoprotein subunit